MAITNGYATLAEYKAWIATRGLSGSVSTDTSDDASIEIIIEAVSRYIEAETGRRFWKDASDATRYYQTDDQYCVKVDDLSAAPTTVSVDLNDNRIYTDLASTVYELYPANAALDGLPYRQIDIIQSSGHYFPTTPRGVKVIAKFGFPSAPTDIKEATLAISQAVYGSRTGQAGSGRISFTDAGIVIRPDDVPPFAQKVISNYRIRT